MPGKLSGGSVHPEDLPRFPAFRLSDSQRAEILERYTQALNDAGSLLVQDAAALAQALRNADQILGDLENAVRTGRTNTDDAYRLLAWEIGESRAQGGVHPDHSLAAASIWFSTVVTVLSKQLESSPDALELFTRALLGLERSISMRIRESSVGYASFLLNMAREARSKERRSIVRDLHDRIGYGLSVAQRQMELFNMNSPVNPSAAARNVEMAQEAILDTMLNLRSITSELHPPEPLNNLEKALYQYITTAGRDDLQVRLQVNGDEAWALPAIRDESFLILREAIRNVFAHAAASVVLIRVDVAPHELRASVEDDGIGFRTDERYGDGVGLISMRERGASLGGRVTITSRPGRGTRVELVVPF